MFTSLYFISPIYLFIADFYFDCLNPCILLLSIILELCPFSTEFIPSFIFFLFLFSILFCQNLYFFFIFQLICSWLVFLILLFFWILAPSDRWRTFSYQFWGKWGGEVSLPSFLSCCLFSHCLVWLSFLIRFVYLLVCLFIWHLGFGWLYSAYSLWGLWLQISQAAMLSPILLASCTTVLFDWQMLFDGQLGHRLEGPKRNGLVAS